MRFLLDTHLLLWLLGDPDRVSRPVRDFLSEPHSAVYFSLVSLWEVAIKRSLGKLGLGANELAGQLAADGFLRLEFRVEHLAAVEALPWHHRDPFDRALVAQSMVEPMTLVTADRRLAVYGSNVRVV